jgi:hypothetical protein
MRQQEWFKRWRNRDGSGEEQDGEGPGSRTLGRMRDVWWRRPMRGRQWDVAEGISNQASPLSHGLF